MASFIDYLRKHMNQSISICLDDHETLNSYIVKEVGDDYVVLHHGQVNKIIPISKIEFIQEVNPPKA